MHHNASFKMRTEFTCRYLVVHTKKQLPSSEMDLELLCMLAVSGPVLTSAVSSEEASTVYIILYEQWVTGTMEAQKVHPLQLSILATLFYFHSINCFSILYITYFHPNIVNLPFCMPTCIMIFRIYSDSIGSLIQ